MNAVLIADLLRFGVFMMAFVVASICLKIGWIYFVRWQAAEGRLAKMAPLHVWTTSVAAILFVAYIGFDQALRHGIRSASWRLPIALVALAVQLLSLWVMLRRNTDLWRRRHRRRRFPGG